MDVRWNIGVITATQKNMEEDMVSDALMKQLQSGALIIIQAKALPEKMSGIPGLPLTAYVISLRVLLTDSLVHSVALSSPDMGSAHLGSLLEVHW
ncbi:hypothetical protein RUM44_010289 [Polyplax serrata]|uniref:Uncharacterized protein n=1 Tax=Polyplax serrata TaxID=468196 RepID=A0ABR1AV38_POLSC